MEHNLVLCPLLSPPLGFCVFGSDLGPLSLSSLSPVAGCFILIKFTRVSSFFVLEMAEKLDGTTKRSVVDSVQCALVVVWLCVVGVGFPFRLVVFLLLFAMTFSICVKIIWVSVLVHTTSDDQLYMYIYNVFPYDFQEIHHYLCQCQIEFKLIYILHAHVKFLLFCPC